MNIKSKRKNNTSLSVRSACFLMAAVAMSRGSLAGLISFAWQQS